MENIYSSIILWNKYMGPSMRTCTAVLFAEGNSMTVNEFGIKKENVVHLHNGKVYGNQK